jgi:hypothetical protein
MSGQLPKSGKTVIFQENGWRWGQSDANLSPFAGLGGQGTLPFATRPFLPPGINPVSECQPGQVCERGGQDKDAAHG